MAIEIREFLKDESGQSFLEYATLAVILLAAVVLVFTDVGQRLNDIFDRIFAFLEGLLTWTPS